MRTLFIHLFFAITTLPVFAQVPSYVPSLGLKGWWSFTGNANDLSGNSNNGTVNGATLTTDRNNNNNSAYSYNGSTNHILVGFPVPVSLQIQNEITLSAWIYATAYPGTSNLGLIMGSQSDANVSGATIFLDGRVNADGQTNPTGHIHFQIGDGGWHHTNTQTQVPLNQWVHIVATRKANEVAKIYYNGVLQPLTSVAWTGSISYTNCDFTFGREVYNNRFFNGKIDDAGVWNLALTQCEIIQLYNGSLFPVITVNSGSICSGGSFTMIPAGAVTYTFEGGNAVVSPTANTSYTVIGTNTAGCVPSGFATSNVTVNALPTIVVNSGSICSGNSFTMIPSGANTYTFSGGNAVVSPTVNTSYSVTGTSTAGCVSATAAVSDVTVNALPIITVNSGSICSGNSFTMIPGGANTYTFSGGNAVVSPIVNTSYSVTGSSTAGCISATAAVSDVTVNALPIITVNSGSICSGQSFTMIPSGANTYTFSGGNAVVSPTANTSYSVTGTSTAGCISATAAVSDVTVNALPIITVNSGSICSGNSFTITPSGANTYTFQGGSAVVSPTANSSYSVTGTSTSGCVSASLAISNITVQPLPTINASTNNTLLCVGQSATLTASGASTYTWNPGGIGPNLTVSPTVTANYTITGTNTFGCMNSFVFTQNVSPCIGINQITNSVYDLNIYPNPFNDKITIVSNGIKQTVQIFNALGSLVHNTTIESEKTEIDLSNQQSGIYFIRIGSITKKIIKE